MRRMEGIRDDISSRPEGQKQVWIGKVAESLKYFPENILAYLEGLMQNLCKLPK